MHKFPIVAVAMIVAAVGFVAVTKAKRTTSTEPPRDFNAANRTDDGRREGSAGPMVRRDLNIVA
jgi:hypothetical protein